MYQFIETTEALTEFCNAIAGDRYITIDTEFHREKTYFPQLCLVQVAGSKLAAIIDPLAGGIDLAPLYALLKNPDIIKVMHACRQDMEIFAYAMGEVPSPVFDTQIAGMVLGFGEQVSYEALVRHYARASLDKSSRFTDWMKRPLTDKQLEYAIADVTHLRTVFDAIFSELQDKDRLHWVEEEMEALHEMSLYTVNPDTAWMRLKFRNTSPKYLAVLQAMCAWREREAQRMNVPRGRLVKDDSLVEIATQKPTSIAELRGMRAYQGTLNDTMAKGLLEAAARGVNLSPEEYPVWVDKKPLPEHQQTAIELVKLLLKKASGEVSTVPRMIAANDELEALIKGERNLKILEGWRNDLFGRHALALLEGNLRLRYDPAKQRVIFEDT
jgi:ribonuclease D